MTDAAFILGPTAPVAIVSLCWIAFVVFWIYSAIGTKKYVRRGATGFGIRIVGALLIILVLQVRPAREFFLRQEAFTALYPMLQWFGAALAVCGVSFMFWARVNLGRNWGMPMSLKKDAELVTTGPYAYVRHPIYSGMILTMLGTTLVIFYWVIPLVFSFIYFMWAATTEERIMLAEFPDRYPDYMRRTKMLIPFIL